MNKPAYKTYPFIFVFFLITTVVALTVNTLRTNKKPNFDFLILLSILSILVLNICADLRLTIHWPDQSANRFICHRILLPVTVTVINALIFVNAWVFPRIGFRALISAIIFVLLIFTGYMMVNSTENYPNFQPRFLKTTVITRIQWIILILIHVNIGAAYINIFLFVKIDPKDTLGRDFIVVLVFCQIINIGSIPLWIPALKAWNSDKLEFSGKHPETKEDWNGFLNKTGRMEWKIEERPQNHNVLAI